MTGSTLVTGIRPMPRGSPGATGSRDRGSSATGGISAVWDWGDIEVLLLLTADGGRP